MAKLVRLEPSDRKKFVAIFSDGTRTHFGGRGCMDYTLYYAQQGKKVADAKRRAYIARHGVTEPWTDPKAAGTLSRFILWELPTVEKSAERYHASIAKYARRRRGSNVGDRVPVSPVSGGRRR